MATVTVTRACTIDGKPVKAGDIAEASGATLANLLRKGWLVEGRPQTAQPITEPEPPIRKKKPAL